MKKFLISTFALALLSRMYAQENLNDRKIQKGEITKEEKEGWTRRGKNSLLFNQAAFSNWVAGGVNSAGALANIDYEFNYQKDKTIWNNRVMFAYGLQSNKGESTKKTEDNINLNSQYRYQIKQTKWYFGTRLNLQTQFTKGYDYKDLDGDGTDEKYETSNFFAPAYLQVGGGIDYVPNDLFELSIHPLNSKITFVANDEVFKDYTAPGVFTLKNEAFGVKHGDHIRYELGLFVSARQRLNLMKNIAIDHQIALYTNYFDHPERVDISYSALLNMTINKYISAQLTGDLLYDYDQIKKLQFKQTLGIGLTYTFD